MSLDSILGCYSSERRWAEEMEETLIEADRDTIPCVFQVPASLRNTKPEAYAPQLMGLGPYHHLRPEVYAPTQKQKLAAIRELGGASDNPNPDIVKKVVEAVSKSVPELRDFYREYIDLYPMTLAWILTVDGLFLFRYLKGIVEFAAGERNEKFVAEMGKVARDIILLENQIPTELLKEIGLICRRNLVAGDEMVHRHYVDYILNAGFLAFCQRYSPLKLSIEWKHIRKTLNQAHLLHVMYHLIVNNRGVDEFCCSEDLCDDSAPESETVVSNISPPCKPEVAFRGLDVKSMVERVFPLTSTEHRKFVGIRDVSLAHLLHHMNRVVDPSANYVPKQRKPMLRRRPQAAEDHTISLNEVHQLSGYVNTILGCLSAAFNLPGLAIAVNFLSALGKVPWEKISEMFQKEGAAEDNLLRKQIVPPTVAYMTRIAGINFRQTSGGIRDVEFKEDEKTFYLPVIHMNTHSEIILRNLVVYEATLLAESTGSGLELAEYVGLLCAIIDTSKDVEILRSESIVDGELEDAEIAAIFNEMRKTTTTTGVHQEMLKVEKFIADAQRQCDNVWTVKVKRTLGEFGGSCWKFMRTAITIVVVVVLLAQAFCTLFSCPRWSGNSRKLLLVADH